MAEALDTQERSRGSTESEGRGQNGLRKQIYRHVQIYDIFVPVYEQKKQRLNTDSNYITH